MYFEKNVYVVITLDMSHTAMKDLPDKLRLLSPLSITLIYFLVAGLWILLTDNLLVGVLFEGTMYEEFQTYKGLFFVLMTSAGLYFLIDKYGSLLGEQGERLQGISRELQSEKKLIDILFERIPVFITIYDPDFDDFEINKEFEKVTGWTNEDVREQDFFKECFPDKELREEVVEFMQNPGIGWREFALRTKSGEVLDTSWTNIRLTDETSVGIGIDMTETKASEARLKQSRQLLENVFESLEESVILVEPETRIIKNCNEATEKIFGYKKDELIGKSTRILHVDEEHYQEFNELGRNSLSKEGVFETEFKMKKKNGEIFQTENTVKLVYVDGEVERVVSVVRDITERKNYERELKERQKRLLRSQEIAHIGDWELDLEKGEITWSTMVYKIYGLDPNYPPPSFERLKEMYVGDDYERHEKVVRKGIEKGEPFDLDLEIETGHGHKKFVRAKGIPEKDENGEVTKLVGTVLDITKRKQMEQALRKNEERMKNITNNVPGVVFQYKFNPDGSDQLQYVSDGAEKIWGVSPEEAKNNNVDIWKRIHRSDIDGVKNSIQKSAETLSRWDEEWQYVKPDGTLHWQHGIGIPRKEEDGSIIWDSVIFDITEKKQLREQIVKSIIEGEDRERKRIARELHDGIGQYLTAANMNLEAINKDIANLSEKRKNQFSKGLKLIKESINEIRNISQNLMPKTIEDYGLVKAIEALIENYKNSTEIKFSFNYNLNEELLNEQEKINIYRIVQETVHNAVKHAECTKISIQLYQEHDMVCLTVEDNGVGIPSSKEVNGGIRNGSGLGLQSIRSRSQAMSASIAFDSVPEKGTVISLWVPIRSNKTNTQSG